MSTDTIMVGLLLLPMTSLPVEVSPRSYREVGKEYKIESQKAELNVGFIEQRHTYVRSMFVCECGGLFRSLC